MYFYTNVLKNDFMNPETTIYVWTKEDEEFQENDIKVYVDLLNVEWYDSNKTYLEVPYKYIQYREED